MAFTYLSIGSNHGNRELYLQTALSALGNAIGKLISVSDVYESQSWGYEGQNFLNMAVKLQTEQDPYKILPVIQDIETRAGRIRTPGKYTDRTVDIDILFMDDLVFQDEELVIPHPQIRNRLFVLIPLMDIDPDFMHPVLRKTISQLRDECSDAGWIRFHSVIR